MNSFKIRDFPWYTILFAMYPILALMSHNLGQVAYVFAFRALWVSSFIAILSVSVFYLLYRELKAAGISTVVCMGAFFLYAPIYNYIEGFEIYDFVIGRQLYFLPVWLILIVIVILVIPKGAKVIPILSSFFSVSAVFLLAFPIFQIASFEYRFQQYSQKVYPAKIVLPGINSEKSPDIYYIVLDMYGSSDILFDEFGHDDSGFLQDLRNLGFYVPECSRSNYSTTSYSLSSVLNINYLPDINVGLSANNQNELLMWFLIQNSGVVQALKDLGYKTVAFETGYNWTELRDSDHYYQPRTSRINKFESLLIRQSLPSIISERGVVDQFQLTSDRRKYDLSVFVLDELEKVPSLAGPKFVFVHLAIPHPPFVIGPSGELNIVPIRYEGNESYYPKDEYKIGYINQVAYLNMRMPQVLQSILDGSEQPPIIIVQGDHGPRYVDIEKQFGVLNAYYFPEPAPNLYPSLSPVNNFRIIFNNYFGTSLHLLTDQSYSEEFELMYDHEEISNNCLAD